MPTMIVYTHSLSFIFIDLSGVTKPNRNYFTMKLLRFLFCQFRLPFDYLWVSSKSLLNY